MKFLRHTTVLIGMIAWAGGSALAQPFDAGTQPFSLLIGPYVQQAAHRNQPDTGLTIDARSRMGLHPLSSGAGRIDWVSRIHGNFAFDDTQTSHRLHQVSAGLQWSFNQPKGRFWLGAGFGFESNGTSIGQQKLAGLNAGWYTPGLFGANDAFQIQFQNAEISPFSDPVRLAWTNSLSPYRRWDAQSHYRLSLNNPIVAAVTLGYQHYQQRSPAGTWSAMGRQRKSSIRFDLPQQFYLQYDRGNSPLDPYRATDNATWRAGWEYLIP